MSRATEIVIGSARAGAEGEAAVRVLLRLTGAEEVSIVSRSREEHELGVPFRESSGEFDDEFDEDDGKVTLGYDLKTARVPKLYRPGTCLEIDVGGCLLSKSLRSALRASIARDRLHDFSVNGVFLRIGGHDAYQVDDADEETHVGRYSVSLTLWGYGTSAGPDGVLKAVQSLPTFTDLLTRFEAEFSPVQVSLVTVL